MFTQQPLFVGKRKEFDEKLESLVKKRKKEGYKVKVRKLYFRPLSGEGKKRIKVFISFKKPCTSTPFGEFSILRINGIWK